MKNLESASTLSRLLNLHYYSGDPANELDDETLEDFKNKIERLEALAEEHDECERDDARENKEPI